MRLHGKPWRLLAVAGVALILASCDPGPLEKAGKAVDRAVEKTGDQIKDIVKEQVSSRAISPASSDLDSGSD